MNDKYYKVLRSASVSDLKELLSEVKSQGWEPVGKLDLLDGEYAQPVKFISYEDDVTEIITIRDTRNDE
jgi:hypothetical protein